jgi:GNAT superfamily N-acetyltransferase
MDIRFVKNETGTNRQQLMEYAARLTGTGDDFWEEHILNGDHYSILSNNAEIGYFTLFGNEKVTSFFMPAPFLKFAQPVFRRILSEFDVKTAFVATCDELFLSLCMDNQKSVELQAYFFEHSGAGVRPPEYGRDLLSPAVMEDAKDILDTEYVAENISAGRYYVLRENGVFLGQGFFHPDTLTPTQASIGMSVHPDHRCKGVGRSIIMHLTEISREKGLTPVCGCWYYNHNSKRTLESAGFASKTRLLNVHFTEDENK